MQLKEKEVLFSRSNRSPRMQFLGLVKENWMKTAGI